MVWARLTCVVLVTPLQKPETPVLDGVFLLGFLTLSFPRIHI